MDDSFTQLSVVEEFMEKPSIHSQFSSVIFLNVKEYYDVGSDLTCCYKITAALEPDSRDWVGLFKVGWRSQSDYFYYDWSPLPKNHVKGGETDNFIVFPGYKLPKDDEFYQFCFISVDGQVRGASVPFQFRLSSSDDLVEMEADDGEMLVIQTKWMSLEEGLKKANESKLQLEKELQKTRETLSNMSEQKDLLQNKLQEQIQERDLLQAKLKAKAGIIDEQSSRLHQLFEDVSVMQKKVDCLNQEKSALEKELTESNVCIGALQKEIKRLTDERDSLLAQAICLKQDNENHKKHLEMEIASSSQTKKVTEEQIKRLQRDLDEEKRSKSYVENMLNGKTKEFEEKTLSLTSQLHEQHMKIREEFSEQLLNIEDKLNAADVCKVLLYEEIKNLRQANKKFSADLELEMEYRQKEMEDLKSRLRMGEEAFKEKFVECEHLSRKADKYKADKYILKAEVEELKRLLDIKNSFETSANQQKSRGTEESIIKPVNVITYEEPLGYDKLEATRKPAEALFVTSSFEDGALVSKGSALYYDIPQTEEFLSASESNKESADMENFSTIEERELKDDDITMTNSSLVHEALLAEFGNPTSADTDISIFKECPFCSQKFYVSYDIRHYVQHVNDHIVD